MFSMSGKQTCNLYKVFSSKNTHKSFTSMSKKGKERKEERDQLEVVLEKLRVIMIKSISSCSAVERRPTIG